MKRASRLIVAIGAVYFALFLYVHVMPEFLCIILSVMLFVVLVAMLLVALISGFTRWRTRSRLWFVPALVCLAFILSACLTPRWESLYPTGDSEGISRSIPESWTA